MEKFGNYLLSKNYKLPKYDYVHKIAFSKFHYLIATKGNLFPDQIVFLENGIVKINSPEELINLSKTSKVRTIIIINLCRINRYDVIIAVSPIGYLCSGSII